MLDKNVCRIVKKIKISDQLFVFSTIKYVKEAEFDEEGNLIYQENGKAKLIPACINQTFLESDKKEGYIDVMAHQELSMIYGNEEFEDNFEEYVSECEKEASIAFYDEELEVYDIVRLNINKFQEAAQFIEASSAYDFYNANEDMKLVLFYFNKIFFTPSLYRTLLECIKNRDINMLEEIFAETEVLLDELDENVLIVPETLGEKETKTNTKQIDKPIDDSIDEILEKLNSLVGLEEVKKEVNKVITYLKFLDKSKGYINLTRPNLNMIFTGNPGTGKTTVARIMSSIMNKLGLANDKILECTAKDFIAEYVGQTAIKTAALIKKAKGGVIFIDEAYVFASKANEFSHEALAEILKEMEKNETIFILSGYKKEMEDFIRLNSGLTSRVGYYFDFKDYDVEQLYQMFELKLKNSLMVLSSDCKIKLIEIFKEAKKNEDFGNGRFIDKLFDNIIIQHAYNTIDSEDKEKLITITTNDINDEVLGQILYKKSVQKRIGFN